MLFFSMNTKFSLAGTGKKVNDLIQMASLASERLYEKTDERAFVFAETITDSELMCGAIIKTEMPGKPSARETADIFLDFLGIKPDAIIIKEITCSASIQKLRSASNKGYITNGDCLVDEFGIHWAEKKYAAEKVIHVNQTKAEIIKNASLFFNMPGLLREIERIYSPGGPACSGHPVHYFIEMDGQDSHLQIVELLLCALYQNKRIRSKRYVTKTLASIEPVYDSIFQSICESCGDGTCVIDYVSGDRGHENPGEPDEESIDSICRTISQCKHHVLTIICISPLQQAVYERVRKRLPSVTFIRIAQERLSRERAIAYLESLAQNANAEPDENLREGIKADCDDFSVSEIEGYFEKWFDCYLKKVAYPQYAEFAASADFPHIGGLFSGTSAYDQLQHMIGLKEAKNLIGQLLNYCKAQKAFQEKGLDMGGLSMHMVFTGNPGTAKTSVARLFARIMKENGILPAGNLLEVGRADLVGKYLGWTAKMVKEKFREAEGSVLFIDEAYSLVDGREGMYGDEAINAIVQEMENQRDSMVVILAGYPDKMEEFLRKNPGMRSRIGFQINFPDYTSHELYDILASLAADSRLCLAPGVREKLIAVFEHARREKDFGNGRFVRNTFEQARLRQADRIWRAGIHAISAEDMVTLCAEDFESPDMNRHLKPERLIGFGL